MFIEVQIIKKPFFPLDRQCRMIGLSLSCYEGNSFSSTNSRSTTPRTPPSQNQQKYIWPRVDGQPA